MPELCPLIPLAVLARHGQICDELSHRGRADGLRVGVGSRGYGTKKGRCGEKGDQFFAHGMDVPVAERSAREGLTEVHPTGRTERQNAGVSTLIIAVLTSLLTTIATGILVGPRLEARNRRLQEAFKARERFGNSVFDLLTNTNRLLAIQVPEDANRGLSRSLRAERARWITKIDQATMHLIDETEHFALGYGPGLGIRELAAAFATHSRAVWVSERSLEKRLQLLHEMASHAQSIYFTAWWRKRGMLQSVAALRQLIEDASEHRR